jgi:hypothetical protein
MKFWGYIWKFNVALPLPSVHVKLMVHYAGHYIHLSA